VAVADSSQFSKAARWIANGHHLELKGGQCMRNGFVVLIGLSILVFIANCGGSSGSGGSSTNASPVAQITSPAEGSTYNAGSTIQFSGGANDSEDGALAGASLVWRSDLDGQVGTGASFSSSVLSPGVHQITLTATDADGAVGLDTVEILIPVLPDTHQTTSYTGTPGEDSDYLINPPHFTKLDAAGNAVDDSATSWAMVRDDVTGMIWEVKTDDGGIHDKDNTYTWQNAQDLFIAQLNSDTFGGQSDWRLPTIEELSMLVHADTSVLSIDSAYFPQTITSEYWSSTNYTNSTLVAWGVDFSHGRLNGIDKSHSYYVRAVRGGGSAGQLVDNGDGTVTDTATGLMWQQAEPALMTWEAALAYCENLNLAGHEDWRLPNRNELQSIVAYENSLPSIDTTVFPGAVSGVYWASTTFAAGTDSAWSGNFTDGLIFWIDKSQSNHVRAVRGGD
jgi:hypothetical protein